MVDRPGKCRQLNSGLQAATGQVILLTDDDVRVPPSWAAHMLSPFSDPTVGLACGPVRGLSRVPGVEPDPGPPPGDAPLETWRFAHGAAMAVRRRAAIEAGGFDERLGPGARTAGEDHDFVLRVRERGWRVVITPAESAEHVGWRTTAEDRSNALSYEKGGGAVVGAALRRSWRHGLPLLKARLRYQIAVFAWNRSFGPRALAAFVTGLAYGLSLQNRNWLPSPSAQSGRNSPEERW